MEFRPEDMDIKRSEDAFRQAYVQGSCTYAASVVVPLPFGLQHEASPYPLSNYVFGGRKNKFRVGATVTEQDMAAVLAKLPQPFHSDPSLLEGAVIAGGDALRMARCIAEPNTEPKLADIDIFFIGGDVLRKADRITRAIAKQYTMQDGTPCYALSRTTNGITVTCHAVYAPGDCDWGEDREMVLPPAIFQFIMREYGSLSQVLSGFDLDASAVAVGVEDGCPHVSALPRAVRALRWQANLIDTDRQSETFEQRIHKYAVNKGFDAIVAGVDIPGVPFQRLVARDGKNGLCALLRMALRDRASDDPTYAGAVHGVNLRYEERTFQWRFESKAMNSSFPMVFAVPTPRYPNFGNDRCDKTKAKKASCPAEERLFPLLRQLIESTTAHVYGVSGGSEHVHVPFEISVGHCNSFRPLQNDWLA